MFCIIQYDHTYIYMCVCEFLILTWKIFSVLEMMQAEIIAAMYMHMYTWPMPHIYIYVCTLDGVYNLPAWLTNLKKKNS